MVQFNAHFDGKVIIPDEPVDLPAGGPLLVTIETVQEPASGQTTGDPVLDLVRKIEDLPCDLPSDLAQQHDHYLYGTPKR